MREEGVNREDILKDIGADGTVTTLDRKKVRFPQLSPVSCGFRKGLREGWIPLRCTGTQVKELLQKVQYHTVSYINGTLSDTYHCKAIIYQVLLRILNMTFDDKIY